MSIPTDQDWCRKKSLVFVVDRVPQICEWARNCLEQAGFRVQTFSHTNAYSGTHEVPALIVVGVEAIDMGSVILPTSFFRTPTTRKVPCIALLRDRSDELRRMAIDAGADECIVNPIDSHELVLAAKRWLTRADALDAARAGRTDFVIDSWGMKLSVHGIEVPTTALEFKLLEYLARHRGQVFTRDDLLDGVWGDMRFINPRSVDACIRRLREKIEPDRTRPTMLKTIRGVGYRLDASTEWRSAPDAGCRCAACRAKENGLSWQAEGRQRRDSA